MRVKYGFKFTMLTQQVTGKLKMVAVYLRVAIFSALWCLTKQIEDLAFPVTRQNSSVYSTSPPSLLSTDATDTSPTTPPSSFTLIRFSPWMIILAAVMIIVFVLGVWLLYATHFPASTSGQILVRIKHLGAKSQPQTIAYESVECGHL